MHMLMTLAVLVTAPSHYSDPILNRQLDRWQTLNGQCRGGASYKCKKKGEQNNKTCEDREFNSINVNGGDKLCQMAARKCTDLVKRKGAMKPRLISCFHADSCFGGGVSFVWCLWGLALAVSRSPLCLLASGEAVAFAVHLQDMDMMSEPVE